MTRTLPWLRFYGDVPATLDYPDVTLFGAVEATTRRYPEAPAYEYFGRTATYREFLADVGQFASALASLGVKPGSRLLISMPTCPQGVVAIYAASAIGAVATLIHPLSPAKEIAFFLEARRVTNRAASWSRRWWPTAGST